MSELTTFVVIICFAVLIAQGFYLNFRLNRALERAEKILVSAQWLWKAAMGLLKDKNAEE